MDSGNEIEEKSKKLEELGIDLSKIQFDFKVKNSKKEEYWEKRIKEFQNYHKKTVEYFIEAHYLMSLLDKEESGPFLLRVSKLRQIGIKLLESMEEIKQNPSIMDLKDQQQSKWSMEQKEKFLNTNEELKNHEKHMNVFFREFYEKRLKEKEN
ncbi:MAG: hypothetical protein GTN97_09160 [Nitrosopumilaceae archaeon]|nr:hypothetical protein [Nitrosopumilaceae archaeon]NIP09787.1 hypothetical protein [Nitrosopumilaceae archaeon]NIS96044.1 hypothetical protein [Nitrosopumilaceae archaeon]